MKKLKLDFGEGGIKGFAVQHIEKLGLGVMVIIAIMFIYSGLNLEGYNKIPSALVTATGSAKSTVEVDSWPEIKKEFTVHDYEQRVADGRVPTQSSDYAYATSWDTEIFPRANKRTDPAILGPKEIEAVAFLAPMVMPLKTGKTDPFIADPPAVHRAKEEEEEATPRPRRRPPRRAQPRGRGEEFGYGDETENYDEEIPVAPVEQESSLVGRPKTVSPQYIESLPGERPANARGNDVYARATMVVAVKALVPIQKQAEEFKRVFRRADGYRPERDDMPLYLRFEAQRADVTADPNADEKDLKWQLIATTAHQQQILAKLEASEKPVADPTYIDKQLTMPIPPVLFVNYEDLGLHSKVPKYLSEQERRLAEAGPNSEENVPDLEFDAAAVEAANSATTPTRPRTSGGGEFEEFGGYEEQGYELGRSEFAGSSYSSGRTSEASAEFKMVRFFDVFTQSGKKYRYRVRLVLEDPNHPESPTMAVSSRLLDETVVTRLKKLKEDSAKNDKLKMFERVTAWSDVSEVVTASRSGAYYAGEIRRSKGRKIHEGRTLLENEQPNADVVVSVFDNIRAMDVAASHKIYRGSVLNFQEDADVLHPLKLELRTAQGFNFHTDVIVVDLEGGKAMPGGADKDNPMKEPSTLILFTPDGGFQIRDELADEEDHRHALFIEDEPSTGAASFGRGYEEFESYGDPGEFDILRN